MEIFLTKGNPSNSRILVWDPFCGTGTTGVAAANFGARFIGTEMYKKVYKIAHTRIHEAYARVGRIEEQEEEEGEEEEEEEEEGEVEELMPLTSLGSSSSSGSSSSGNSSSGGSKTPEVEPQLWTKVPGSK